MNQRDRETLTRVTEDWEQRLQTVLNRPCIGNHLTETDSRGLCQNCVITAMALCLVEQVTVAHSALLFLTETKEYASILTAKKRFSLLQIGASLRYQIETTIECLERLVE